MYGQKVIIKRKPSISETKEENNNYTVTDMDAQVSQNTSADNNNSVTIHTHSENGNISEHHFHTIVRPNSYDEVVMKELIDKNLSKLP